MKSFTIISVTPIVKVREVNPFPKPDKMQYELRYGEDSPFWWQAVNDWYALENNLKVQ